MTIETRYVEGGPDQDNVRPLAASLAGWLHKQRV